MSNSFTYHSARDKCPLCGGIADCRSHVNGSVYCRRADPWNPPATYTYCGDDVLGFHIFRPDGAGRVGWISKRAKKIQAAAGIDPAAKPSERAGATAKAAKSFDMFERIKAEQQPLRPDLRRCLADKLGVSEESIDALGVTTWHDDRKRFCWIFPERDGNCAVIGYQCRYFNGDKRNHGRRGLTIPLDRAKWLPPHDPAHPERTATLFIVEGASDVAACLTMGLYAIGRPSNTGGVENLKGLLAASGGGDQARPITVMGENDQKQSSDGRTIWPGRDGAERVSGRIAEMFDRVVHVSYPPVGCKDLRDWPTKDDATALLAHLLSTAQAVNPPATQAVARLAAVVPLANPWWLTSPHLPVVQTAATEPLDPNAPPECCPNQNYAGVFQLGINKPVNRVLYPECKRLSCPYCGHKKRELWINLVKSKLFEQSYVADEVFLFWCERSEWKRIYRHINARGGEFFRINPYGGNTFRVCTNVHPGRHVDQGSIESITCADAAERLAVTIRQLPKLDIKMFTKSRGWQEKKRKKQAEWESVGRVRSSIDTVRDIAEQRCAGDLKTVFSHSEDHWQWQAVQWRRCTAMVSDDHLRFEMEEGCRSPENVVWESRQDGESSSRSNDDLLNETFGNAPERSPPETWSLAFG